MYSINVNNIIELYYYKIMIISDDLVFINVIYLSLKIIYADRLPFT